MRRRRNESTNQTSKTSKSANQSKRERSKQGDGDGSASATAKVMTGASSEANNQWTNVGRRRSLLATVAAVVVMAVGIGLAIVLVNTNSSADSSKSDSKSTPERPTTNPAEQNRPNSTTSSQANNATTSSANRSNRSESSETVTGDPTTATLFTTWGSFTVLETIPHDATAFTQGLVTVVDQAAENGNVLKMYEGTGIHSNSQLRLLDMQNGTVLAQHYIERTYFGEGIAHYRTTTTSDSSNATTTTTLHLIQLTWQEQVALEYTIQQTLPNEQQQPQLSRPIPDVLSVIPPTLNWTYTTTTNEGWGITYVPEWHQWIVSDGSQYLHFWDVATRQQVNRVAVTYRLPNQSNGDTDSSSSVPPPSRPLTYLNELEWDPQTRTVLANVWMQDVIVRIDPISGFVVRMYNMQSLFPIRPRGADVLNGIALTYDASLPAGVPGGFPVDNSTLGQVWITGKYWPNMYLVQLVD
jgi:glutaminyl-peptide cyclotransferase